MSSDPYHPLPSSSSSRFQSTTNPNSARSSLSLMSIPTDEEKWIPSPVPTLSTRSLLGGTLRKRRILVLGGMTLAMMGMAGWYLGGLPDVGDLWDDMGDGMSPTLLLGRRLTSSYTVVFLGSYGGCHDFGQAIRTEQRPRPAKRQHQHLGTKLRFLPHTRRLNTMADPSPVFRNRRTSLLIG